MMMHAEDPVDAIASTVPGAAKVLAKYGIDYSHESPGSLSEACRRAGVDPAQIRLEIEQEAQRAESPPTPAQLPVPALMNQLRTASNLTIKRELPRLEALTAQMAAMPGSQPDQDQRMAALIHALHDDLSTHLAREEDILFPWVLARLDRGCIGAETPIACLRDDHDRYLRIVHHLRDAATKYDSPSDSSATRQELVAGLRRIAQALTEHISLENDHLFPQVLGQ